MHRLRVSIDPFTEKLSIQTSPCPVMDTFSRVGSCIQKPSCPRPLFLVDSSMAAWSWLAVLLSLPRVSQRNDSKHDYCSLKIIPRIGARKAYARMMSLAITKKSDFYY